MSKQLEEAAKEYRLQAKLNPEKYLTFGSNIINAFIAGANWQKEQTLNNSIEGYIVNSANAASEDNNNGVVILVYEETENTPIFKAGDKAKFIVIKEAEK